MPREGELSSRRREERSWPPPGGRWGGVGWTHEWSGGARRPARCGAAQAAAAAGQLRAAVRWRGSRAVGKDDAKLLQGRCCVI